MKRDMDLWRKILRSVEAREETGDPVWVELEGYTDDQISFHVKLLIAAGLLEGEDRGGDGDRHCYYARCLTNKGYNFLDAAKNDTRWNKGLCLAGHRQVIVRLSLWRCRGRSAAAGGVRRA